MKISRGMAALAAATVALTVSAAPAQAAATVAASRLSVPWGVGFLPDGTLLFTERTTAMIKQLRDGTVTNLQKVPGVTPDGEGGLLGLAVSPKYAEDKTVYIYYTTGTDNRIASLTIGSAPKPIVTGIPRGTQIHNGGRLAFGPDGFLYAGTGDAGNSANAQNTSSLAGKILRMTPDGKPAPGNPFGTLVYSYGHRNAQGLTWTPDGKLYEAELGQDKWDELNLIEPGKNYGWPTCEGKCGQTGFVDPLVVWATSEASPSGIAYYKNNLYMAGLRGARMWVIPVTNTGPAGPHAIYQGQFGRLRSPVAGPDGMLWFATSNRDGRGSPVATDDRLIRSDGT